MIYTRKLLREIPKAERRYYNSVVGGIQFDIPRLLAEHAEMAELLEWFRTGIFKGDCVGGHRIDNILDRINRER